MRKKKQTKKKRIYDNFDIFEIMDIKFIAPT